MTNSIKGFGNETPKKAAWKGLPDKVGEREKRGSRKEGGSLRIR